MSENGESITLGLGDFIFNSVPSSSLSNSKIQLRPEIFTPKRKSTFISVPGVDGDYILDENAYENTNMTLELICEVTNSLSVTELRELITYSFDSGGYVPLELYFDPNRIYYAKVIEGPNFRLSGQWPNIVLYSLEFSLKPFKEITPNYTELLPDDGSTTLTIENPSKYASKPIITLNGTGDMALLINDETFNFKGVDDYIIVDSTLEEAYKIDQPTQGIINRNNKMFTREFPLLKSGNNVISYTDATSIKVEGRWLTLVG